MNKTNTFYFFMLFLLLPFLSKANNLLIENVSIPSKNSSTKTATIQFDISWENSWRVTSAQNNWDAVWVFVKFKNTTTDYWQHATLSYGSSHSSTSNLATIDSDDDTGTGFSKGAFIYSASTKSQGNASYQVQLEWQYGQDSQGDDDTFEIKVYGIEMVYVPSGAFYLGTGGSDPKTFYMYNNDNVNDRSVPYFVESEGAITVGTTNGNLYYDTDENSGTFREGDIPADFPKGFSAFYCMKYEITQGQYADFLNMLRTTQVSVNHISKSETYGNNLETDGSTYSSSTSFYPQVQLSHRKILNYLEWACLRPMTEMEYEKACRGTQTPVALEYAWGSTDINDGSEYTIDNGQTDSEVVASSSYSASSGNIVMSATAPDSGTGNHKPLRVGIFATSGASRVSSGATYYGIMNMSGNVTELVVTVSVEPGRSFDGSHGSGALDNVGNYTNTGWPNTAVDASATDYGYGSRGGAYVFPSSFGYVSTRNYVAYRYHDSSNVRECGGRGVRTAPSN
ncbi:SUMF1/EgtB/PvdO family nonheme iron enzyme [Flammeovirga aprica]|uniref:SUMF1/EgtB/PvdO family nonheme iron enzyme n=1 Tax=Flammeovirga aprica JL-4 TaxID=694437 RepID=A0A7X9XB25_9BACT|nr:SUMF1/EgtB/PvdO family nonheme iron enzyme [Flammeovirga aprica]NME70213.1 SUMF1/EgtB/PvdO family nonheme iron enzyme [Flammeovirga aprica JL-4]